MDRSNKKPASVTLGDFELTIISDGTYLTDGGAMFGVIPKPLWSKCFPADEENRIVQGLNSLLVRTGDKTVLIETGIGNKSSQRIRKFYDPQEKFLENLALAAVAPEDIDIVINSHLHFDHCGWNTMLKNGKVVPTFPRARHYFQFGEWQHGKTQHVRDWFSYIDENYDPLIENGQAAMLKEDREIASGIRVETFPGHTPHMQAIIIESQGKKACYISDLIPTMAHADITWTCGFDQEPYKTIESRMRFYQRAIPENWLVIFTHDPDHPLGYLEKNPKGKVTVRPLQIYS